MKLSLSLCTSGKCGSEATEPGTDRLDYENRQGERRREVDSGRNLSHRSSFLIIWHLSGIDLIGRGGASSVR